MDKKTCAIIVTYNRLSLLKECLEALKEQTKPVNHIVIVNNASTDGTSEYLDKLDGSNIIIEDSIRNIGGAGGFSTGLKIALDRTNDDYFWLMDDDTIVANSCNKELVNADDLLHGEEAFLISNVRWINGDPANVMMTTDNWPEKIDSGLVQVKYGSFVSYMVTRKQVEKFGLPIADMFIWGDDTEFSRRIAHDKVGYFVIGAHATHKSKSNNVASGLNKDSVERISRYFYLYRNSMYTKKKYEGLKGVLSEIMNGLKMFVKILISTNEKKISRINVLFTGICKGLFFKPKIKF